MPNSSGQVRSAALVDLVDGDPSSSILTAWIAKEELRALLACARTGGHRHDISTRLHRFNTWCAGFP